MDRPHRAMPGNESIVSTAVSPTDAEIVRCSMTRPERFGELYTRHHERVRRYVASRCQLDEVDDIVSEVFLIALAKRESFRPLVTNALPWLLGIAANLVRRHRRSEVRRQRLHSKVATTANRVPDFADDAAERIDQVAREATIRTALGCLDQRDRVVLLLGVVDGYRYRETARALSIPIGTVRSRISRARTTMANLLTEDPGGSEASRT